MNNFFIESDIFRHQLLCDIDSYYIEMTEALTTNSYNQYFVEATTIKKDSIFTRIGNLIKSLITKIKKFFSRKPNETTEANVKKLEQSVKSNPDTKTKKWKIIDPTKIKKLSKEDLKKGAKAIIPCVITASIPTIIGLYKGRVHKKESQTLEGEINKLKRDYDALHKEHDKLTKDYEASKNTDFSKKLKEKDDIILKRDKEAGEWSEKYRNAKAENEENKKVISELNKKISDMNNSKNSKSNEQLKKIKELDGKLKQVTEELADKQKQLDLLIQSQKQVEAVINNPSTNDANAEANNNTKKAEKAAENNKPSATTNTASSTSTSNSFDDRSKEEQREIRDKLKYILESYRVICGKCNITMSDQVFVSNSVKLIRGNGAITPGITKFDIQQHNMQHAIDTLKKSIVAFKGYNLSVVDITHLIQNAKQTIHVPKTR